MQNFVMNCRKKENKLKQDPVPILKGRGLNNHYNTNTCKYFQNWDYYFRNKNNQDFRF